MKTDEEWAQKIAAETVVPDAVIEEATHNPIDASHVRAIRQELIRNVRRAFADYHAAEGCSCCRNIDAHERAAARLARFLEVPKYDDGSGHDFWRFRSPERKR